MSTSPKSTDMRLLAIKYLEEGKTAVFVSKLLNIHPNTARSWYSRFKKTGNTEAKKRPGAKPKVNKEELKEFVSKNPDLILIQIAAKFKVSKSAIHYNLQKLKFRYKKKTLNLQRKT